MKRLFLNHVDAWQVALVIATLALLIHDAVKWQTVILLAAITAGYWLAFAVNDFYDASCDAADEAKARANFFAQAGHFSAKRIGLVFSGVTCFLLFAFARFGWRGIAVLALCYLIMWAYSAPPLRLRNRPGWDLLVHALFVQTFPYLICLFLVGATWTSLDTTIVAIVFLASLTAQLEQQVRDYEVDRKTGRNFATQTGIKETIVLLKIATAACMLVALAGVLVGAIPLFMLPFGLIGLPALLHRFVRRPDQPRSERLVAISTTTALLYTGSVFIYFLFIS